MLLRPSSDENIVGHVPSADNPAISISGNPTRSRLLFLAPQLQQFLNRQNGQQEEQEVADEDNVNKPQNEQQHPQHSPPGAEPPEREAAGGEDA